MVSPALISAGASLLGGLFGSKSKKKQAARERQWALSDQQRERDWALADQQRERDWALGDQQRQRDWSLQDQSEFFARTREAAQKAGFNPLAVMGFAQGASAPGINPTGINPTGINPTSAGDGGVVMGQAIADAGMMLADSMSKSAVEKAKLSEAMKQNVELKKKVNDLTLRPKVGGVYAQREAMPSAAAASSGSKAGFLMEGPLKPVKVWNSLSGEEQLMDPRGAKRLGLKDGDAWIGEDEEAVVGDVASNIATGAHIGVGAVLYGTPLPYIIGNGAKTPKKPQAYGPNKPSAWGAYSYGF